MEKYKNLSQELSGNYLVKISTQQEKLTKYEEDYYFEKAREGDHQAIEKICLNYTNLIKRVIYSYGKMIREKSLVDDLVQIGIIAVMHAIEYFDESMKVTFLNYASACIRRRIQEYLDRLTCVKVPPVDRNILKCIEKLKSSYYLLYGGELSTKEISDILGEDYQKMESLIKVKDSSSLSSTLNPDEEMELGDSITYDLDETELIINNLEYKSTINSIKEAFFILSPLEKRIVECALANPDLRLADLWAMSGIKDREGVYVIFNTAVSKLQLYFKEGKTKPLTKSKLYSLYSKEIEKRLYVLDELERDIILLRSGLYDGKKYTVDAIVELYNITKGVVKSTEKRAVKKLKLEPYEEWSYELKEEEVEKELSKEPKIARISIYNKLSFYSKEEIDEVLSTLNEEDLKKLLIQYPLENSSINFTEVCKSCGLDRLTVSNTSRKILTNVVYTLVENKFDIQLSYKTKIKNRE